jgi:hypothetical protein
MSTESTQRVRRTTRSRVRASLIRIGMDPRTADRWCDLWEAEAARQTLANDSEHFWDAAKGWIDAQRKSTVPLA